MNDARNNRVQTYAEGSAWSVGRGRLLVVNMTVGGTGSATWVHHCIRTSAMTRCVFRRIIFFHELGRPFFFCLVLSFFSFSFSLFFFFLWNATAYFAQFAIRYYAPVYDPGRKIERVENLFTRLTGKILSKF